MNIKFDICPGQIIKYKNMRKTSSHKKSNKENVQSETFEKNESLIVQIKLFIRNWGVLFLNSLIIVFIIVLSVANESYLLKEILVLSTIIACLTMLSTLENKSFSTKESNQVKNR
jgi:uncharacterized ion transporter superfamily protein YfcC